MCISSGRKAFDEPLRSNGLLFCLHYSGYQALVGTRTQRQTSGWVLVIILHRNKLNKTLSCLLLDYVALNVLNKSITRRFASNSNNRSRIAFSKSDFPFTRLSVLKPLYKTECTKIVDVFSHVFYESTLSASETIHAPLLHTQATYSGVFFLLQTDVF
jgi:hypothetical protein